MGAFNITIKGHGAHHNRNSIADANRVAKSFVDQLKRAGHDVSHAEFQPTGGEAEDLKSIDYSGYDDPPAAAAPSDPTMAPEAAAAATEIGSAVPPVVLGMDFGKEPSTTVAIDTTTGEVSHVDGDGSMHDDAHPGA